MSCLPTHGRVDCTLCHPSEPVIFDHSKNAVGDWRITFNPLAWGNPNAEIVVLGFSKGPTQSGALTNTPHDEIAYKGSRTQIGRIFDYLGLVERGQTSSAKAKIDGLIADKSGRFHFGSLIRCTVERYDKGTQEWKGSGGGMLDKFIATEFGRGVARRCSTRFLSELPTATKLVIMFGLGAKGKYVAEARRVIEQARPGAWRIVNEVAYTDGKITVVHVEHFASQGALLPQWLGERDHARHRLALLARAAVSGALGGPLTSSAD